MLFLSPPSPRTSADLSLTSSYLLAFDCVSFNRFLETLLSSQGEKKDQSPWLFTTAADVLFRAAKARVYIKHEVTSSDRGKQREQSVSVDGQVIPDDLDDGDWGDGPNEEEEMMLRAMEAAEEAKQAAAAQAAGAMPVPMPPPPRPALKKEQEKKKDDWWMPPGVEPVLEEQPKWLLLADVLDEIENELHWGAVDPCESLPSPSSGNRSLTSPPPMLASQTASPTTRFSSCATPPTPAPRLATISPPRRTTRAVKG